LERQASQRIGLRRAEELERDIHELWSEVEPHAQRVFLPFSEPQVLFKAFADRFWEKCCEELASELADPLPRRAKGVWPPLPELLQKKCLSACRYSSGLGRWTGAAAASDPFAKTR